MSSPVNPNVTILTNAWAMLWTSTSKFYLPTVLANGGTFGSTTIPPLQSVAVNDVVSIPLYSSSTWGHVDISLTGMTVTGIPQVSSSAFTPSNDATSITGTLAFTQLELAGAYEVDGSSVAGCAMDLADSQANSPNPTPFLANPGPAQLDLARQYRDQLVQQGGNGTTLVSTYYDHNDTINMILNDSNAFTSAWPLAEPTPGLNTAYFMSVTTDAGNNPDNPTYPVGDTPYQIHGYFMQNMLLAVSNKKKGSNPDPEDPYALLSASITGFKQVTLTMQSSYTVNDVMSAVQNAPPTVDMLTAVPESAEALQGRLMAERDFPMWEATAAASAASKAAQVTTYKSTGNFDFQFPMPSITFNATVAVAGISPNETLTVTITQLTAAIPNIAIVLLTGSDPSFTADAQSDIQNAQWFQQHVGTKVNAALNGTSLLNTVSGIFNQALLSLLPGNP